MAVEVASTRLLLASPPRLLQQTYSALCQHPVWKSVFVVSIYKFLPARASELGNVIGSVRHVCAQKKIVIERTRDLIYLKFVATDFFPKVLAKTPVT